MALHDTLYALGLQSGRDVFDDPDRLRGLLVSSGAAGAEVDLVVDAVRRGAHRGLVQALDAGTDPVRAVEATGDRLGQESGTDPGTARWAVAVLGFALGRVGENDVRRQRAPGGWGAPPPGAPPSQAPTQVGQPAYPPTPPQGFAPPGPYGQPYQQGQPGQPAYAGGYPQGPQQGYGQQPGWSAPPKKSKLPILLGVGGTVVAIVIAVVLALVLTNGGDDDTDQAGDDTSTSAEPTDEPSTAETSDAPTLPTEDPTTEPTSEAPTEPGPDGEVSIEAASGYTTALLAFSDAFGAGGEDLQTATTADDTQGAKAAARKMSAAVSDLDLAVRDLELSPVQAEVDAFYTESARMVEGFDEIERTAASVLDVNAGVAGLPITDYTDSFQAVADAISASQTG